MTPQNRSQQKPKQVHHVLLLTHLTCGRVSTPTNGSVARNVAENDRSSELPTRDEIKASETKRVSGRSARERLIGSWKQVSDEETTPDGKVVRVSEVVS